MTKPLNSKLLVKLEKTEEVSKGGIILAPQAQATSIYAIVLALGTEVDEEIKVGDKVILDKFSTKFVLPSGDLIIDDSDILGIETE